MEIAVLIEPCRSQGFRATAPIHPEIYAEGPTEEAAIQTLRDELSERLKSARLVTVEIPVTSEKPWMAVAGSLKDGPDQDAYREAILEYRCQVDADPER